MSRLRRGSRMHARVFEWHTEVSLAESNLVVCHGLTSKVLRGIYSDLSRNQVFALKESQDGFFELRNQTEALCAQRLDEDEIIRSQIGNRHPDEADGIGAIDDQRIRAGGNQVICC